MKDELRCGECGGKDFRLHYEENRAYPRPRRFGGRAYPRRFGGGGGHLGKVIVHCANATCKSESTIEPTPAALETSGSLCGGWKS